MQSRPVTLSSLALALLLIGGLTWLSQGEKTSAAGQPGVPFGVAQLQEQLAALQASVEALQPRTFYLTVDLFDGAQAPDACAPGYHMASLWEIHDPTSLRYDTTRGFTQADSGSGPPNDEPGWMRTGNLARRLEEDPGQSNCLAYTSNSAGHFGTTMELDENWGSAARAASPWEGSVLRCDVQFRVWCVHD